MILHMSEGDDPGAFGPGGCDPGPVVIGGGIVALSALIGHAAAVAQGREREALGNAAAFRSRDETNPAGGRAPGTRRSVGDVPGFATRRGPVEDGLGRPGDDRLACREPRCRGEEPCERARGNLHNTPHPAPAPCRIVNPPALGRG